MMNDDTNNYRYENVNDALYAIEVNNDDDDDDVGDGVIYCLYN
jgi:hypothetical protein